MDIEVLAWDPQEEAKSKLKAFSALASQGAALIRSKSMDQGSLSATFSSLEDFWKSWSDAAHLPGSKQAGLGGVVVDESGQAISAFSEYSEPVGDRKGAMLAEMKALQRAMELAWESGARKLEMRFDCMPLVRSAAAALMGNQAELSKREGVELLAVMDRFECLALRWIPRESNRFADALSKRALGGGLFHGGSSQEKWVSQAWADPESGLGALDSEAKSERRSRASIVYDGVSKSGVVKIALGACWRASAAGGEWVAAASCADPLARKEAKIEPSESWGMGSNLDQSLSGMRSALIQALAKKASVVAFKASGAVEKFKLYLPKAVWEPMSSKGELDEFVIQAQNLIGSLAPGSKIMAEPVEQSVDIAQKQAAHLINGWELGRATMIHQIQEARRKKRLSRSKQTPSANRAV